MKEHSSGRRAAAWTAALAVVVTISQPASSAVSDPFTFFSPWVTLSRSDRGRLARNEVVVRILPANEGELAVFAASRLNATPDTVLERIRAIESLRKSAFVPVVRRFSNPPMLEDLATLRLDDNDLEDLRGCRPGDCDLKLPVDQIEALQRVASQSGHQWKDAVQVQFRKFLLARASTFLEQGFAGLPAYDDRRQPVSPSDAFMGIIGSSPYLIDRTPEFASHLQHHPHATFAAAESFLYWSKERFGGKPTVTMTHVTMLRTEADSVVPPVLVASTQIFASHYTNGALGLTAVLQGELESHNYLVYVNRSSVDVLDGVFSALKRRIIQGRIEDETAGVFRELRRRLESGRGTIAVVSRRS